MLRRAFWTLPCALALLGACRERAGAPVAAEPPAAASSGPSAVPSGARSGAPGSSAPAASSPRCNEPCAPGTACHLTAKGPACVACAPGSAPTCEDARFVASCDEGGTLRRGTDCAAEKKRCDRGRCAPGACTPGRLHCFDGDVYRCNEDGEGRALATRCVEEAPDGTLDTPRGLCQEKNGVPACRRRCDLPDHSIVALHGCEPCRWEGVPFCATESPERGCTDWICLPGHDYSPGAVAIPCTRSTDGLAVPGSDERGACEGTGAIGRRKVRYQVCRDGQPAAATRVEPCSR
jgi:hypothetical protein